MPEASTEVKLTRSQKAAADVTAYLRARQPIIWIRTREEQRVEAYLFRAMNRTDYTPRTWDVGQGLIMGITGDPIAGTTDPSVMLERIRLAAKPPANGPDAALGPKRGAWILRDFPIWMDPNKGGMRTLRQVRNLARMLPGIVPTQAQALIILSPSGEVPAELADHTVLIDWPLPDREEIGNLLDIAIRAQPKLPAPTAVVRDAGIEAAVGLTGEEMNSCFARSLVQYRGISPAAIAQEKKRVVARDGLLSWYDPLEGGMDAVGGLDQLKAWITKRKSAYSPSARTYGLRPPKGFMLIGVPGCGKSRTAKALAGDWGVPLLRLDLGSLKSKYVGDSEQNLRKVFDIIAAIGRCVVWLDEIEKALAGATQGAADGGVSADALGAILSWMQERQGEAFVIATANQIQGLPPELLRKGRFDDIFFIDLPNELERVEVLRTALREAGRDKVKLDLKKVARATAQFCGSEIAELVPDAMFNAFSERGREITTQDLIDSARTVRPLSELMKEQITALRKWASERARLATTPIDAPNSSPEEVERVRVVDLEEGGRSRW